MGFDSKDAWKIYPMDARYMNLHTVLEGTTYGLDINYLPVPSTMHAIAADIMASVSGEVTLSLDQSTLPDSWTLMVRDNVTGQIANLTRGETLKVTVSGAAKARPDNAPVMETVKVSSPRFTILVGPDVTVTSSEARAVPTELSLSQNYPNPFNPTTNVTFTLPAASNVNLAVYDMSGRKVDVLASGMKAAGSYTMTWNASNRASGVYLLRLEVDGGKTLTRKMTLLK
jgi:hypothetical protein